MPPILFKEKVRGPLGTVWSEYDTDQGLTT